jgi:cytidylate kinase
MGALARKAEGLRVLMPLLACFSGRIGSGKSSVSEALAQQLGWRRTSFSDYLRVELQRRGGDPGSREALQDLGQSLVEADGEAFCRAVLIAGGFQPGGNFLLDGVRHVDIFRALARLARPSSARLIFLAADDVSRHERVAGRPDGRTDFARAEAHLVEADMKDSLPAIADLCVNATQDLEVVVDQCLTAIRQWTDL